MLRFHKQRQFAFVAVISAALSSLTATAGNPKGNVATAEVTAGVPSALRAELSDDNATRNRLLSLTRESAPDNSAARWQSGLIDDQTSGWVPFQDVRSLHEGLLEEYRGNRSRCGTDPDALMRLADWCHEKGLLDAERAHLTQIIAEDANHAAARKRLGFVNLDGQWVSSDDINRAAERQRAIAESVKQWGESIQKNVRLMSGGRRQRDRGREQLFAIRDVSAIPAMEHLLAAGGEPVGLLLIEWLSQLNAYQAGQSIARTALVTRHEPVRHAAADALQSREFDEFMPILMGALKTPVEMQSKAYVNPQGWVVLDLFFDSETQNEWRQLHWSTEVGKQVIFRQTGGIKETEAADYATAKRYLLHRERQANEARLQWNELIRQTNERSESVLRAVTEQYEPAGPEDWWDWWIGFNELDFAKIKPSLRVQPEPERVYIRDRDKQITDRRPLPRWENEPDIAQGSCLVAGTPVWTELGAMPVEQIQIGERVLAQDVDSGELAYKPVLATTVRPPVGTFDITTDAITVRATGGHPFWVNGEGWRFARDLKPGMCLHGADGSEPIKSVEPADEAQAFNLVVADFHSYYIGEGDILSHDNTPRDPTNALVPGLHREP